MSHAADTPRRRWLFASIAAAIVLLVGCVVLAYALMPRGNDAATSQDPVPSPTEAAPSTEPLAITSPPIGALTQDELAEIDRATETAMSLVGSTNEIAQRGDGSSVGVDAIATGFALGELQAMAREQFDLGYRQIGDAVVTGVTASAVDLTTAPATMTLTVCVDVSDVDVLDAAGNSLKASLYNPSRPVKHIYGAQFTDGVWKIATHDIPDEQDCPSV